MCLEKRRILSVFLYAALVGLIFIGSPSMALPMVETVKGPIDPENASGQTVKIGAVYNLAGSQSPLDLPSARGARLAAKQINAAGGIDGKQIDLILCDGRSDSAKVSECAQSLIRENVSAMVGLSDTDMLQAAVPVSSSAGIPFLTSGATSPALAEEYDSLFLACFGDDVQAAAGALYAYKNMGLKDCALLVDGDMEYAILLSGYFKDKYRDLGGEIVMEAFINGSNMSRLSQAVEEAGPDMIYLAAGPDQAGDVIQALRSSGIRVPVFGGDSFDSADLRRAGTGTIVFSTHALLDDNSSRTIEFEEAYRAEYGNSPENAFAALGYDAVRLLGEALDAANSSHPQAIQAALGNISDFQGVTGGISYGSGRRVPEKDVTMITLFDGEIAGWEAVRPEQDDGSLLGRQIKEALPAV